MKNLTTLLLTLLVLGGCGYSSEDECYLKEMQKCESKSCENQAYLYCAEEFRGDSWFSTLFDLILSIGFYAALMITAGALGGYINSFFSSEMDEEDRNFCLSIFILGSLGFLVYFFVTNA